MAFPSTSNRIVDARYMYMTRLSVLFVFYLVIENRVSCYNLEVQKVGKFQGERGSQFGYTVAIVRAPGWTSTFSADFYRKQLLVGAPNVTFDGIQGHGQVSGCSNPGKANLTCKWLNVTDISNLCSSVKKYTNQTDCFKDARLGATLEVNRKFPDIHKMTSTIPMVTVCGPGWKNVYPELDIKRYQNYMFGICLKLREELQPLDCQAEDASSKYNYCWPFWATRETTTNPNGRPIYTYAQGGISATFTQDGLSEVVGGPGADDWRGAYIAHQKNWVKRLEDTQGKTIYFAYALTSGKLLNQMTDSIVSGTPNYYASNHGHYGKFETFTATSKTASVEFGIQQTCPSVPMLELRDTIDKDQMGSKFGASLAAVDLNGDGFDEVLVGAPLYSGSNPEEGRVFVYTFKDSKPCGPIGIFSGAASSNNAIVYKSAAFARFGTTIASAGDLDKNGINDVAIGAPYEDHGRGALYIYHGTRNTDSIMPDTYVQRIAGADIDPGIRSFGWSMYGNEDVDDNSFPDLAVGAYKTDTAVLLRARPIVNVEVRIEINPSPIPLNGSSLKCSRDGDQLCFNMTVHFQYTSIGSRMGKVNVTMLTWTIDADTLYKAEKGKSRVVFQQHPDNSSLTENITLTSGKSTTKEYILDVRKHNGKPEPQDAWTKVRMEGSYTLVPLNGKEFDQLDPILHKDAKTRIAENVEFDKKCESLDKCTSDLVLKVDMFLLKHDVTPQKVDNNTVIYVDAFNELEITADVKNVLNSSYRANVSGDVTAVMKKDISSNNGVIGASCSRSTMSTNFTCSADSKLDLNENIRVKSYFDITSLRLVPDMDVNKMKPNITIDFRAGQANKDVNENNNVFISYINISLKYDIHIQEDKDIYDQIRYKADEKSTRMISLTHRYNVINNGPSFLPLTYINITIPVKMADKELAIIQTLPTKCVLRGSQVIGETTTHPDSTTNHTPIAPPEVERRRRDVAQTAEKTETAKSQENIGATTEAPKIKNITCNNAECQVLECRIEKLKKNQRETLEIVIQLHEKEIATMKDIREVRYGTTAIVTDPMIWYGGKVVPFDHTVYAEKWTTLVVEPASVVSEINIWIIIGSVLGAVALLVVIVIILWRCGFFKRKKHSQVQEWKRASLYNRKSARLSTSAKPPYTSMADKDKEVSE